MASYTSATFKNTGDLERGGAIMRSPLHKSMEFQAAVDSVGLDGLGIVYKGPPSYASSTSPKVTGQPRWRDTSRRPHHRRTSTAAIIALAQKQSLTPQKVIAIFSIGASATYLARALPPLWPNEPTSVYNPRVVYHPAEIYEAMRPADPKHRSKKARKAPLKAPRRPQIIVSSETAQSVEQAKAKANQDSFANFFDQVEPKYWKNVNDKNYRKAEKELLGAKSGLDGQVLGKAVPKGQEEDFAMVDDLASEDVEALILDEEEDAMYDARAFSADESEVWDDAVHLDPNAKVIEKPNSLPLPLRGSHHAPGSRSDQSIAGLALLANNREIQKAAKVIKPVVTKTEQILPRHTERTTIFEDEERVEMMGDILMKKKK